MAVVLWSKPSTLYCCFSQEWFQLSLNWKDSESEIIWWTGTNGNPQFLHEVRGSLLLSSSITLQIPHKKTLWSNQPLRDENPSRNSKFRWCMEGSADAPVANGRGRLRAAQPSPGSTSRASSLDALLLLPATVWKVLGPQLASSSSGWPCPLRLKELFFWQCVRSRRTYTALLQQRLSEPKNNNFRSQRDDHLASFDGSGPRKS